MDPMGIDIRSETGKACRNLFFRGFWLFIPPAWHWEVGQKNIAKFFPNMEKHKKQLCDSFCVFLEPQKNNKNPQEYGIPKKVSLLLHPASGDR